MDFSNLVHFMEDSVTSGRTPGNQVCVYQNGKEVFSYVAGFDDLEKTKPLTGDELYNIYSCSKVTTVTAALQLLEKGYFLITDPISAYMPEFTHMMVKDENGNIRPAKNQITVGDLFSMTAGFDYIFDDNVSKEANQITNGHFNTRDYIRCLAKRPLNFEPGTHWMYSLGHDVLAAFVEAVSGMKFRDYVKKNIFDPLDMKDTYYHHTPETLKRTAEQYLFVADNEKYATLVEAQIHGASNEGHFENVGKNIAYVLGDEYDSGGAGIITNVRDYVKLMNALANDGAGATGVKILSQSTIDLMRTNRLTDQAMEDYNWQALRGYGYGLGVRTHMNPAKSGRMSSIGEFGWGGAAGATCMIDPSKRLALFYAQHTLNPREEYYQPRLINVTYSCL